MDRTDTDYALITVKETAALLGQSRQKVYRWLQSGELPGLVRFGRNCYVVRQKIEDWLQKTSENGPRAQDFQSQGQIKQHKESTSCNGLLTASKRRDTVQNGTDGRLVDPDKE
jgi:excisionase family DNA binding protein